MTNDEQSRALRTAIKSLQSGLLTILEFLNILAAQSSDPEQFKQQIEAIKTSLQLVDNLPPPSEDASEDNDSE